MERKQPSPVKPNKYPMEESKDYKPKTSKVREGVSSNIEEYKERVTKRMSTMKRSASGTII